MGAYRHRRPQHHRFLPECGACGIGKIVAFFVILYLICFAIWLYFQSRARSIVVQNFTRGKFDPDAFLQKDNTPVGYLQAAETDNTVIYRGFNPLVGSELKGRSSYLRYGSRLP
jgi:hypothetical protein